MYDKFNSEINSELIINGYANNFDEFFDSMRGEGEALFKKNLIVGLDASNIINIKDRNIILKEFKRENKEASIKAISIESNRFQRAHTILAVFSTPVIYKKIPEWEQNLSAGSVCTNLLYADY